MTVKLHKILDSATAHVPKQIPINLPKLKKRTSEDNSPDKIKLPELKSIT